MLSSDLALLYQIPPRVFMQAVKRNIERFPQDFMFQLTPREFKNLRSRIVTPSWGGIRKMPYAFSEQGIAMLSGVLRSHRATTVNIEIMRAFVHLGRLAVFNEEVTPGVASCEAKYDARSQVVFDVIRVMMNPPSHTVASSVSDISTPPSRTIETATS
jgi:hypothetical protein